MRQAIRCRNEVYILHRSRTAPEAHTYHGERSPGYGHTCRLLDPRACKHDQALQRRPIQRPSGLLHKKRFGNKAAGRGAGGGSGPDVCLLTESDEAHGRKAYRHRQIKGRARDHPGMDHRKGLDIQRPDLYGLSFAEVHTFGGKT